MTSAKTIVLVAEDDEDDFFFTARMLRKVAQAHVIHVESGRAAIDYLEGNPPYADRNLSPFPDHLLLDLKMEDVDGHEVLAWLREHGANSGLKVFVLTGSGETRDRERVRASGVASGYYVKPLSLEHLGEIFREKAGLTPKVKIE
jgi:CheY-like chemotaxis protein